MQNVEGRMSMIDICRISDIEIVIILEFTSSVITFRDNNPFQITSRRKMFMNLRIKLSCRMKTMSMPKLQMAKLANVKQTK